MEPKLAARIASLKHHFEKLYDKDSTPSIVSCAPGRAEILGSHTDYNQGHTLSANINHDLLVVAKPHALPTIEICSLNQSSDPISFSILNTYELEHQKSTKTKDSWANYVKSVAWAYLKHGYPISGFKAVLESEIPLGGGVSSSAALETAIARILNALSGTALSAEEQVILARQAEAEYVGAPCGYLDQATIGLAESFLSISHKPQNNRPFSWKNVTLDVESLGYKFVIGFDPESKHALVDGKYALRQTICHESIPRLKKLLDKPDFESLGDISPALWKSVEQPYLMQNGQQAYNFVTHIVYENDRVSHAVNALQAADMPGFGKLMTDSGKSAIYLYGLDEDAPELRFVFEYISEKSSELGVLGIRNMGGGFNATTLALVKTAGLDAYMANLTSAYQETYNRPYHFLPFEPAPPARIITQ